MALSKSDIYDHPALFPAIRQQSAALLAVGQQDPRLTAPFATQQRWLMSHVALSLYFQSLTDKHAGAHITTILDAVVAARIASRNTADSFLKEMLHYKFASIVPSPDDRRLRPLVPKPHVLAVVGLWMRIHLNSLDLMTGGSRVAAFDAMPDALPRMQPLIAEQLVTVRAVRNPERTFSLFTWLDNGGWIMDWLISSMEEAPISAERVTVGRVSTADMADRLKLSRTHLARKLLEAESMGSLGWMGRRGQSVMWVSRGFREEYATAQAAKLSIIDHASEAVLGADMAAAAFIPSAMQPQPVDLAV